MRRGRRNSKAVGHCRRLCVRTHGAVFREGTVWDVEPTWRGAPTSCPPHAKGPRPRSDEEKHRLRAVGLKRLFCGGGTASVSCCPLSQINAELGPPTGNTPNRPSRRDCNKTRICSPLGRTRTGRSCGGSAESARRDGHSLRPRTHRARLVMSSNRDSSSDR
jgi:hypothetical protein